MTHLMRVCCCLLCLGLFSCAIQQQIAIRSPKVASCIEHCEVRYRACAQDCTNNCTNCSLSSKMSTTKNYKNYLHEQQVKEEL